MLALVGLDPSGAASYDFYVDGTAERGWQEHEVPDALPDEAQAIQVGSISSWLHPGAGLISQLVVREHHRGAVLISFDPNLRPALVQDPGVARACVEQVAGLAHVVKVSAEDLRWLFPMTDPDDSARRWAHRGPALVVLTDGAEGARAYRPGRPAHSLPAHDVPVVDTVGAGDAFTAGLLVALSDRGRLHTQGLDDIGDDELGRILATAGMVAALTCSRSGADPPTRAELEAAFPASRR